MKLNGFRSGVHSNLSLDAFILVDDYGSLLHVRKRTRNILQSHKRWVNGPLVDKGIEFPKLILIEIKRMWKIKEIIIKMNHSVACCRDKTLWVSVWHDMTHWYMMNSRKYIAERVRHKTTPYMRCLCYLRIIKQQGNDGLQSSRPATMSSKS